MLSRWFQPAPRRPTVPTRAQDGDSTLVIAAGVGGVSSGTKPSAHAPEPTKAPDARAPPSLLSAVAMGTSMPVVPPKNAATVFQPSLTDLPTPSMSPPPPRPESSSEDSDRSDRAATAAASVLLQRKSCCSSAPCSAAATRDTPPVASDASPRPHMTVETVRRSPKAKQRLTRRMRAKKRKRATSRLAVSSSWLLLGGDGSQAQTSTAHGRPKRVRKQLTKFDPSPPKSDDSEQQDEQQQQQQQQQKRQQQQSQQPTQQQRHGESTPRHPTPLHMPAAATVPGSPALVAKQAAAPVMPRNLPYEVMVALQDVTDFDVVMQSMDEPMAATAATAAGTSPMLSPGVMATPAAALAASPALASPSLATHKIDGRPGTSSTPQVPGTPAATGAGYDIPPPSVKLPSNFPVRLSRDGLVAALAHGEAREVRKALRRLPSTMTASIARDLGLVEFNFRDDWSAQAFDKVRASCLKDSRREAEKTARAEERRLARLQRKEPKYRRLNRCVDRRPAAVRSKDMEDARGRTNGRPCICAKKLGINNTYKRSTATRGGDPCADLTGASEIQKLAAAKPDKCCGEDCLNSLLYIECTPEVCSLAGVLDASGKPVCRNRRLQTRAGKAIYTKPTPGKGWGLFAGEDIKAGDFVIEYVGEVFDDKQIVDRLAEYKAANEVHFHMMEIHPQFIIDAGRMGNQSRFINHSCDPNCDAHKFYVGNNVRIGIFAGADIAKDQEITYDYQWDHFSVHKVQCKCGAPNCVGFLGGKPKKKPTPADKLKTKFGDPGPVFYSPPPATQPDKPSTDPSIDTLLHSTCDDDAIQFGGFSQNRIFVANRARYTAPLQLRRPGARRTEQNNGWHYRAWMMANERAKQAATKAAALEQLQSSANGDSSATDAGHREGTTEGTKEGTEEGTEEGTTEEKQETVIGLGPYQVLPPSKLPSHGKAQTQQRRSTARRSKHGRGARRPLPTKLVSGRPVGRPRGLVQARAARMQQLYRAAGATLGRDATLDAHLGEFMAAVRDGTEYAYAIDDLNDARCTRCNLPGDVLCCDTCPRVYHLSCLCLSATDIPPGEWSCPACVRRNRTTRRK